ncbi:uncharacterized protein STEHIDRAFT_167216 [Stereum hirsutum FP-91666 SS1]|uniref:uncharacterized protein n=1 Tax=Stereum hirsutum (strain FP-91666) TaxID=721885 RepID=UPI000440B011|nr:uncharacterized protein STEHIDRAFT_167216 [Stereum hirsutum FP-91666 SS1]EIM87745.1 hypothetical protein STEHIDRAFT_167216 [Stereum hirsutum FP-91666 SS1]
MPLIKSLGSAGLFVVVGLSVSLTALRIGQTVVHLTTHDVDPEPTYSWIGNDRPSSWDLNQRSTPPVLLTLSDSTHYALNNTPLISSLSSSPSSNSPSNSNSTTPVPHANNDDDTRSHPSPYSSLLSNAEWSAAALAPGKTGHVRLGPDHRIFALTLSHQNHCLKMIQRALLPWVGPTQHGAERPTQGGGDGGRVMNDGEAKPHHVRHCFDYLRQTLLCSAASTVERGDFMKSAGRYFGDDSLAREGTDGDDGGRMWRGDTLVCEDWESVFGALDGNLGEWEEWKAMWN